MQGDTVPFDFNYCHLWVLPKGDNNQDCSDSCIRDLSKTRPLSGANTDAKLFASCLAHVINSFVNDWAFVHQRGFIRGRNILENVLQVENALIKKAAAGGSSAAAVLFDFKAAFPSISRKFIFEALHKIGMPPNVIYAIQQLYKNNKHFFPPEV